jgi:raffinose/stachyose/melibiose transport system substrate-binding protein
MAALAIVAGACFGGGGPTPGTGTPQATPGGSPGGSPSDATGAPGTAASGVVKWLTGIPEDPINTEIARQEATDFEAANPGIDLQREEVENDQLRTILQTRLGSNDPPDLFGADTGPGFGGVLARAGLVADLTDAYEQYGWEHFDWAVARCTYGGKKSCLPDQVEELGIFYNKTMFDEKGFVEPETVEELEGYMDAFKADGVIPLAYGNGGDDTWTSGHMFSFVASNLVGREGLDELLYGDARWNDPRIVQGIQLFFRDWVDAGYFPPSPTAVGYDDANALFYGGEAAMVPTGTWLVGDLTARTAEEFEVGFFPFPSIDGSSVSPPAGIGAGLFMAANSKNPEGALAVMDYLHGEEAARNRMERVSQIPAFEIDTSGLELSPLFQEVIEDLAGSSGTADSFGYNIDVLTPANFNDVMAEGFQEVMNGDRTPQEQADALDAAYQEAKEAGDTMEDPNEAP